MLERGQMADSQKMASRAASGGQRIEDHKFWAGGRSKGSVFPEKAKTREISDQEGAGSVMRYEDTEEAVKEVQSKSVSQIHKHKMKPSYRN